MEEIKPHSCCAASTNMFIPPKNCVNPPKKTFNCLGEALKVKQDDASVERLEAGRWPKTINEWYIHLGTYASCYAAFRRLPKQIPLASHESPQKTMTKNKNLSKKHSMKVALDDFSQLKKRSLGIFSTPKFRSSKQIPQNQFSRLRKKLCWLNRSPKDKTKWPIQLKAWKS